MKHKRWLLQRLPSPLGQLLLVTDEQQCIRALDWVDYEARMQQLLQRYYVGQTLQLMQASGSSPASEAIAAYFAGVLTALDDLPVATGGTPFQQQVWRALRSIPAGTTLSYQQLAQRIERPRAIRAVGMANAANPVSLVLPCHRVIGARGTLTGYAGGLERKQWLLTHEQQFSRSA